MTVDLPTFEFNGFTLRVATADDLPLAQAWTDADPDHRGMDAHFWIEQKPGTNSMMLEDAIGPIFFFKMERVVPPGAAGIEMPLRSESTVQINLGRALELHIQFAPGDHGLKLRTMQGLSKGMGWLEKNLAEQGYDALFFTSKNPRLITFCECRLEFTAISWANGETRLKRYITR